MRTVLKVIVIIKNCFEVTVHYLVDSLKKCRQHKNIIKSLHQTFNILRYLQIQNKKNLFHKYQTLRSWPVT